MLTDIKIKSLKPKDKEYRVADSHGLTLAITPKGVKKWYFRYRFNEKPTMTSLGQYPAVSLAQARTLRDKQKSLLAEGINPTAYKKKLKVEQLQSCTFKDAFDRWFNRHKDDWTERTGQKQTAAFEKHIFPYIGNTPIDEITTPIMLDVLRKLDNQGKSVTLKKIKGWASRIFKDCVVEGLIPFDPIVNITGDQFKKHKEKHHATLRFESDIKALLTQLSAYKEHGTYQIAQALNIAPYLMLRPGELSGLLWEEVEFDNGRIRISAERMKMDREHLVFLSTNIQAQLQAIKSVNLCDTFVFPSPNKSNSSISPESLRASIRRLGISKETFTTHGFRSMASTRLNEMGFHPDYIERQLAHVDSNKVRAIYNNAEYLEQRKDMMQKWSDYLDKLKD